MVLPHLLTPVLELQVNTCCTFSTTCFAPFSIVLSFCDVFWIVFLTSFSLGILCSFVAYPLLSLSTDLWILIIFFLGARIFTWFFFKSTESLFYNIIFNSLLKLSGFAFSVFEWCKYNCVTICIWWFENMKAVSFSLVRMGSHIVTCAWLSFRAFRLLLLRVSGSGADWLNLSSRLEVPWVTQLGQKRAWLYPSAGLLQLTLSPFGATDEPCSHSLHSPPLGASHLGFSSLLPSNLLK